MRQCKQCLTPLDLKDPETVVRDNGSSHDCFCDSDCSELYDKRHPKTEPPVNRTMALAVGVLVALALLAWAVVPARGAWDGEEGAMSQWFQSLHDLNGRSCCGMGDYHRVNYRGKGDGAEIEWKGNWYEVPEVARVKNYTNPTGEGAAFFYEDAAGAPREIFCFIRAVEG